MTEDQLIDLISAINVALSQIADALDSLHQRVCELEFKDQAK